MTRCRLFIFQLLHITPLTQTCKTLKLSLHVAQMLLCVFSLQISSHYRCCTTWASFKKGRFCAEVSQLFASFKVSDTSSLAVHSVSIKAGKNATKCLTADLAAHGGGKHRPAHSNMQLLKAYLFTLPLPRLLPPVFVIVCVCVFKICCCLCHLSLLFTDIVDSCWSVFTCYAICDFSAVLHELLPLVSRRITKFYLLFFVSSGSL